MRLSTMLLECCLSNSLCVNRERLIDGHLSLYLLKLVMEYYNIPEDWMALFNGILQLNKKNRNPVDHQLISTTDEQSKRVAIVWGQDTASRLKGQKCLIY